MDILAEVSIADFFFLMDRWRSRNLLSSVMLEDERRSLERAGNIVSQALTPMWRNSRG